MTRIVAFAGSLALMSFGAVRPPSVVQSPPAPQQPIFATKTVGVRVDVLVSDLVNGRPVGGLAASDFELRDNGVVQRIDAFDYGDLPINAVLALDLSGSTSGKPLADTLSATGLLLDKIRPVDRVALTTFTHAVTSRVPLTSDVTRIKAVLNSAQPSGGTSLLDAIYVALMTTQAEAGRSFVLVCTDGRDTSSWLQPDEVLESAKRSNAIIYVVASARARRWAPLTELTGATGGHTIEIDSSTRMADEFRKILEDFRSRYVLTYVPTGVVPGGFHRLQVKVRRSQLKVTARPGYVWS